MSIRVAWEADSISTMTRVSVEYLKPLRDIGHELRVLRVWQGLLEGRIRLPIVCRGAVHTSSVSPHFLQLRDASGRRMYSGNDFMYCNKFSIKPLHQPSYEMKRGSICSRRMEYHLIDASTFFIIRIKCLSIADIASQIIWCELLLTYQKYSKPPNFCHRVLHNLNFIPCNKFPTNKCLHYFELNVVMFINHLVLNMQVLIYIYIYINIYNF